MAAALAAVAFGASVVVAAPAPRAAGDGNEAPGRPGIFQSITAGDLHTCVRVAGGALRCWGENGHGQLGHGNASTTGDQPGEMKAALLDVPVGTGRAVTSVSAGIAFGCVTLDDATVKCWGWNRWGQLGTGDQEQRGDGSGEMGDNLPTTSFGPGRSVVTMATGGVHACVVLDDDSVRCWGAGDVGQLGNGTPTQFFTPQVTDLGTGRRPIALTGGYQHSCALFDDHRLKCWGSSTVGQTGLGDTNNRGDAPGEMGDDLPLVDLGAGRTVDALTAGFAHSCALLDGGAVKCWGFNSFGTLGLGDTANRGDDPDEMGDSLPAIDLGTGRTATAIASGANHVCALLDTGEVKCWGNNQYGQLGLGDTNNRGDAPGEMGDNLPAVDLGTGRTALAITAGNDHTCAVLDNSTLKCWGANSRGQLGLGDTRNRGNDAGEMGDNLPIVQGLSPTGIEGTAVTPGGTPLTGVLVAALRASDYELVAMSADVSSSFSMDLPPGQYLLYVIEKTGAYRSGFHGAPTAVDVPAGQRAVVQVAPPAARGSISGTLADAVSGAPIGGAWVLALTSTSGAFERAATTNASGQFTITDLQPGTHLVAYLDPSGAHPGRFHPNSMGPDGATHVNVVAGATTTIGASIEPQPTPGTGGGLSGNVSEAGTATPLSGIRVLALRADDFTLTRGTTTDASGNYTMNLPAGSYRVAFVDPTGAHAVEWYNDKPATAVDQSTPVAVPASVSASLARTTGGITGIISTAPGTSLPSAWAVAIGPNGIAAAGTMAANGNAYSISGLPVGNYRAVLIDPFTARATYWQGAPDYDSATPFAVAAGVNTNISGLVG